MSLYGLPDFHAPLQGDGFRIYYPFEGGSHLLLSEALEIAQRDDGRPDLQLEFVRGQAPDLPPQPYGTLSFRLRSSDPIERALTLLRMQHPTAQLTPIVPRGGWLRLRITPEAGEARATTIEELAWNGLGITRSILRISATDAQLIKGALLGSALAVAAVAELVVEGVAARVPLSVTFDPTTALAALLQLADYSRHITYDKLLAYLHTDPVPSIFSVTGELATVEPLVLAEALAERLVARFGAYVASPALPAAPTIELVAADTIGAGVITWDLAQPELVQRVMILEANPLEAARALAASDGVTAVCRELVVETINSGYLAVEVDANLPERLEGILGIGATLSAPPALPFRPQAIIKTVELSSPEYRSQAVLRFSPIEAQAYACSTYLLVRSATGVRRLDGQPSAQQGARVHLTSDDFAAALAPISADRMLLELADLVVRLTWETPAGPASTTAQLTRSCSAVVLAYPRDCAATITVEAQPRSGAPRTLGPLPAGPLRLGLYLFPEYGPHTVQVSAALDTAGQLLAIELQAESDPPDIVRAVLFLTSEQPQKPWGWMATSPFCPGYRYRSIVPTGQPAAPWSSPQPYDAPLLLAAATPEGSTPMPSDRETFEGVDYYVKSITPLITVYLPGAATPQRDPQGEPTLSCLVAGGMTMLQLGVELQPDAAALERLRQHIAAQRGIDAAQVQLTPAPVTIESVTLALADEHGAPQTLATSQSSGFPPYNAIFSVQLDDAQKSRALSAIGGQTGLLSITYRMRPDNGAVRTVATDIANWFTSGGGMQHVQIIGV